jgi:hypothetical protein
VLRNDNCHPVQLFEGRSYVQLVPTAYYTGAIGEFHCLRQQSTGLSPAAVPPNSPTGDLPASEEDLVRFLLESEAGDSERGTGGFGSTDELQQ